MSQHLEDGEVSDSGSSAVMSANSVVKRPAPPNAKLLTPLRLPPTTVHNQHHWWQHKQHGKAGRFSQAHQHSQQQWQRQQKVNDWFTGAHQRRVPPKRYRPPQNHQPPIRMPTVDLTRGRTFNTILAPPHQLPPPPHVHATQKPCPPTTSAPPPFATNSVPSSPKFPFPPLKMSPPPTPPPNLITPPPFFPSPQMSSMAFQPTFKQYNFF